MDEVLLIKAGRLDGTLGGKLMAMVGFRNIAVHNYQDIDPDILRAILAERQTDLRAFAGLLVSQATR